MIVGVAGLQNSGKTTLLELLIPLIAAAGFTVATVKHIAHNDLRVDTGGTDTHRHRRAGARLAVAASDTETVYFHGGGRPLDEVLARLEALEAPDLVLVEGFKRSTLPKIVIGAVEHGGEARWRWDGTPKGAASIAEDLMTEVRAERARSRKGAPAPPIPASPGRRRAGARARLRAKRSRGGGRRPRAR